MPRFSTRTFSGLACALPVLAAIASPAFAQERLPWQDRNESRAEQRDYGREEPQDRRYEQGSGSGSNNRDYGNSGATVPGGGYSGGYSGSQSYGQGGSSTGNYGQGRGNDAYSPPRNTYSGGGGYSGSGGYASNERGYGAPYSAPAEPYDRGYGSAYPDNRRYDGPPPRANSRDGTFSADEIAGAGHRFFGSVSKGMASAIEYVFKRQGRPNGYILGEDAGGAFVAGLRYGEGVLYTRDAGEHKVYWQGPSIGYDFGGEGSKVMVLVYNLRDPSEIYDRFGGVAGSAYVVGGVGLNFQAKDHIVLAPIRAGVGLRFGANVGYLKYTPKPTWNPF